VLPVARLALLLAVVGLTASCGASGDEAPPAADASSTTTTVGPEPTTTQAEPGEPVETEAGGPPLPGLPAFTAGYATWDELAKGLPPRDGDPHLGTKNVFSTSRPSGGSFPAGTIIVKEAVRPGNNFVGLIATMRKVDEADPDHNDWVFVEYTRESGGEPFSEVARDSVCWSCHLGAEKTDYVFVLGDSLP
jgi:hypothetical protein